MAGYALNLTPISLLLLLLFLFVVVPLPALGDACANVNCVKGTCIPDNSSILGYNCDCYPGWKKVQVAFLTFPACILPNCTMDLGCESHALPPSLPPPSPPPPASPPPPFNLLSPCNLVWCGDGTCVVNGSGYNCQCNDGSANLLNLTELPCIKQCSFGVDCSGIMLGQPPSPPPPNGTLVPPLPPPLSPPNGSNKVSMGWRRSYDGFYMVLLSAIILATIM